MRAGVRALLGPDALVRLLGRKRAEGDDAMLDRQLAAVLELQRISRLPALDSMEPVAARRFAEGGMSPLDVDPIAMAEVIDTHAGGGIPMRIFVPHDAGPDWFVYFHGGGGVIGSIASSEPATRYLADRTKCTIASVGYRLGPEDRHPAGIEDAHVAWAAIAERAPASARIAVGGDSFGGFLTAHVEHHARTMGGRRPDLQVLIYPLVDLTLTSPSIERFADGYLLTKSMIHWFRNHYLHPDDDQRAGSPWFWDDRELVGAAPAIVATAGYDPLVDEGDAWAGRLAAQGVPVRHLREDSLVHGYLSLAGAIRTARAATDRLCAGVVEMLRT
jgi:acetyl esterase